MFLLFLNMYLKKINLLITGETSIPTIFSPTALLARDAVSFAGVRPLSPSSGKENGPLTLFLLIFFCLIPLGFNSVLFRCAAAGD